MAITDKRGLYSWGDNSSGQLGRLDSTRAYTEPGEVSAFTSGWTQASASPAGSSLAIASDGNLYSWGDNTSGQLGRDPDSIITPQDKPGRVTRPAGSPLVFSWAKTSGGAEHSMAVGGDGNLYTWGDNSHGQLTHASTSTPGRANLVVSGIPTNVKFDQTDGTLVANTDGIWTVTTPAHDIGEVTVTIDWTLDGVRQTADTSNRYMYQPFGVLPNAGGTGIGLLLLTGLILMACAVVHRRLRHEIPVTNQASRE